MAAARQPVTPQRRTSDEMAVAGFARPRMMRSGGGKPERPTWVGDGYRLDATLDEAGTTFAFVLSKGATQVAAFSVPYDGTSDWELLAMVAIGEVLRANPSARF